MMHSAVLFRTFAARNIALLETSKTISPFHQIPLVVFGDYICLDGLSFHGW
jgi:hypothetical protein